MSKLPKFNLGQAVSVVSYTNKSANIACCISKIIMDIRDINIKYEIEITDLNFGIITRLIYNECELDFITKEGI